MHYNTFLSLLPGGFQSSGWSVLALRAGVACQRYANSSQEQVSNLRCRCVHILLCCRIAVGPSVLYKLCCEQRSFLLIPSTYASIGTILIEFRDGSLSCDSCVWAQYDRSEGHSTGGLWGVGGGAHMAAVEQPPFLKPESVTVPQLIIFIPSNIPCDMRFYTLYALLRITLWFHVLEP
jgi:hypothetical protein